MTPIKTGQTSGSTLRNPKTEVHCPCGVVFKTIVHGHGTGHTGLGGSVKGRCPACLAESHADDLELKLQEARDQAKKLRERYPRPKAPAFTL